MTFYRLENNVELYDFWTELTAWLRTVLEAVLKVIGIGQVQKIKKTPKSLSGLHLCNTASLQLLRAA